VLARAGLIKVSTPSAASVRSDFPADKPGGKLTTSGSLNTSEVAASGTSD
jgi:hypothetical protein